MKYLLDTCVISELNKPLPNENVIQWIKEVDETLLYISVLTIGEIEKGIAKLPDSPKKEGLMEWLKNDLRIRFRGKILEISEDIAIKWGEISGTAETLGKRVPAIDGLIAASAITMNMTVVTRNTRDIENTGCQIINPWKY